MATHPLSSARSIIALAVFAMAPAWTSRAVAVDRITFQREGQMRSVDGRVVVTAQDGGCLLQSADGTMWALQPDEITEKSDNAIPFSPLTQKKAAKQLLTELPDGFRAYTTARYIICYNTSRAYAVWCGGLFERLHRAFVNYWTRQGFELHKPEFPLVAIVFSDASAFRNFAQGELGDAAGSVLGYYSLRTNRVLMYDLTGAEALRGANGRRRSAADINRLLARPQAEPLVATIVHEATHQVSYNIGLQTRYADNPAWLSEGLAIYFETPDLSSGRGWRGIGQVNHRRLTAFRSGLANRRRGSLPSLIAKDLRFKDIRTGPAAYAEAWALNYFLIHQHSKGYSAYLELLAKKPRLEWDEPAQRLVDFKTIFGDDLDALDAEFLKYIEQLR